MLVAVIVWSAWTLALWVVTNHVFSLWPILYFVLFPHQGNNVYGGGDIPVWLQAFYKETSASLFGIVIGCRIRSNTLSLFDRTEWRADSLRWKVSGYVQSQGLHRESRWERRTSLKFVGGYYCPEAPPILWNTFYWPFSVWWKLDMRVSRVSVHPCFVKSTPVWAWSEWSRNIHSQVTQCHQTFEDRTNYGRSSVLNLS